MTAPPSTAFVVRRRRDAARNVVFCANDCRETGRTGPKLPREATHEVLICGYPTLVCGSCARNWKRIWAGALDDPATAAPEQPEAIPRFIQPSPGSQPLPA